MFLNSVPFVEAPLVLWLAARGRHAGRVDFVIVVSIPWLVTYHQLRGLGINSYNFRGLPPSRRRFFFGLWQHLVFGFTVLQRILY